MFRLLAIFHYMMCQIISNYEIQLVRFIFLKNKYIENSVIHFQFNFMYHEEIQQ